MSSKRRIASCGLFALLLAVLAVAPVRETPAAGSQPRMGTHWADASDFGVLRSIGYDFAVVNLDRDDPATWQTALDAAAANGIRLIVGLWPPPWHLAGKSPEPHQVTAGTSWIIEPAGTAFLQLLAAHPEQVLAVFGYNEPYWTDEFDANHPCGYYSADELRRLRLAIRNVWPEARIFHDLDAPSVWAPGGSWWGENSCIGDRYADQTGIADFVGIWSYPFHLEEGYTRASSLAAIRHEVQFVQSSMAPAVPVILGQAFGSQSNAHYFPSHDEMRDWSCAIRRLGADYISWYPWRLPYYDDDLSRHPEHWPDTMNDCAPRHDSVGCHPVSETR